MSSVTPSPIPLYHQVFTVLRQRVLDGAYPPGARLAPEDELAAEFDVSRATIRQAVGALVRAGMVSRQQGRGTFVLPDWADDSLARTFHGSLADLVAAGETRRITVRRVSVEHDVPLPPATAARLALPPGARGTIVRRVREMDGELLCLMVDHLTPAVGARVGEHDLRGAGLLKLLQTQGVAIARATQTVRAQLADVTVAQQLEVGLGSAVMHVERVLCDDAGAPVDHVHSWYRGDRYAYTVTFDRGDDELSDRIA